MAGQQLSGADKGAATAVVLRKVQYCNDGSVWCTVNHYCEIWENQMTRIGVSLSRGAMNSGCWGGGQHSGHGCRTFAQAVVSGEIEGPAADHHEKKCTANAAEELDAIHPLSKHTSCREVTKAEDLSKPANTARQCSGKSRRINNISDMFPGLQKQRRGCGVGEVRSGMVAPRKDGRWGAMQLGDSILLI